MVCGMKEYLKQSLEVWGRLNWTLFPLREAVGFRAINACSFMSTSLWTIRWKSVRRDSARLCSSNGQSRSCSMLVTLNVCCTFCIRNGLLYAELLPGVECCPLCMDPILELHIPSWVGG